MQQTQTRGDSPLTEEQMTYLDKRTVQAAQQLLTMRKFYPAGPTGGGLGVRKAKWYKVTEMGDAYISWEFEEDQDMVNVSPETAGIPVMAKEWGIKKRDWETWKLTGGLPDDTALLAATRKLAETEENYLLYGWAPDGSNYEIKGLYEAAGQTKAGADFGTYGNAASTVGAAALLLMDAYFKPPYDLLLPSTQLYELLLSRDDYGNAELPQVRAILNGQISDNVQGGRGGIYLVPELTAGTGLMMPTNRTPDLWDLMITVDYQNTVEELQKTHDLFGRVYIAHVPRIKQADALVTLTGI